MEHRDPVLEQAAVFYERYAPLVLAYLLRRLDSLEDAEDVLLEVFTVVLEKSTHLPLEENSLRAWILTVARNKVVDHYRRHSRLSRVPWSDIEKNMPECGECEPEMAVLRQEEYRQLQIYIRQLPKLQQEILQWRFGKELHCGEIALVIGRSESAVRALLYRALKSLRGIYDKERVIANGKFTEGLTDFALKGELFTEG